MLDAGLVMFVCLLVLLAWRYFFPFIFCSEQVQQTNYSFLLYAMLLVLLAYDVVLFISTAMNHDGRVSWDGLPKWLRPMMLVCPGIVALACVMCFCQTGSHLLKIRTGVAAIHHDQVVQIIALPAVYSVMAFSALTRLYQFHTNTFVDDSLASAMNSHEQKNLVLSRSETCFLVADLFESWALYQFGKMTLSVLGTSISIESALPDAEKSATARGMMLSHGAVESLTWAGIIMFLLVCFFETGWSLYLLNFASVGVDQYKSSMTMFTAAGFVASSVAIWNVAVVEHTFYERLGTFRPILKFVTVKILVSFAYLQKGVFYALMALRATLPDVARNLVQKVPLFGDILDMDDNHFELFYSTLIIYECLIVSILHFFAWSAAEPWYDEVHQNDERTSLLPKSA